MALPVELEGSSSTSVLPWIWILEELLGVKDVGTPLLKEIISAYIPNLESQDYGGGSLQKRIALRYLEELLAANKIDACAIPLVKALISRNPDRSSFNESLLLRVQTEAVLTHIRGRNENGERDWEGFKKSLNHVFLVTQDPSDLVKERTKELMMISEGPEFENESVEIFERYSLQSLRQDLFQFIILQKGQLCQTFLDQWSQKASNVICDEPKEQDLSRKRKRMVEYHKDKKMDEASEVAEWNVEYHNDDGIDQDLDNSRKEESILMNAVDEMKKKAFCISEPEAAADLKTEEHQDLETMSKECNQEQSHENNRLKGECETGAVNADVIDDHNGDLEEEIIRERVDDDMQKSENRRTRYSRRHPVKSYREVRIIPGLRRKNLPWSKLEVNTLKEGVKRFSDDGTKGFQWARILEFGHRKFDISRTSVDLKDKWRNISKGGPC